MSALQPEARGASPTDSQLDQEGAPGTWRVLGLLQGPWVKAPLRLKTLAAQDLALRCRVCGKSTDQLASGGGVWIEYGFACSQYMRQGKQLTHTHTQTHS